MPQPFPNIKMQFVLKQKTKNKRKKFKMKTLNKKKKSKFQLHLQKIWRKEAEKRREKKLKLFS